MRFSTRIILTVGFSALLLTSLYWLVGWHYVEELEAQQDRVLQEFIGQRADLVVAGQLAPEALALVPGALLYREGVPRPEAWQGFETPGVYEVEHEGALLVRVQPDTGETYAVYLPELERLVEPQTSETAEALVVVGGILLFTLGSMGLTLLLIWKQTVPVRQLMQAVAGVSPESPCLQPLARSDELGELSRQFAALLERTQAFIQREQNFTRFASHELRTPLMTIRSSLTLLQEMAAAEPGPLQQRALRRIAQALERMEKLTDSFLWLSREDSSEGTRVDRKMLEELLEQLQLLTPALSETLVLELQADWCWSIHPFVLSVLLDNLLRNAQEHGDGDIEVRASQDRLLVRNRLDSSEVPPATGGAKRANFGYGLPIVELLAGKAGARFSTRIADGHFEAEIRFSRP
ncbi:HAMP domain-containing sensor histidine kinase [Marinobacterium maritimum]|uniref:histidine kinase n=1 Tax=Marinobacterium maritimum TaxID=500162 RepID=A0ABN1I6U0_9GAMM